MYMFGFRTSSSIDVYNRAQLDRRRLEEAHLKYSILQVYRRYPKHFTEWCISSSVAHTLDEITPTFFTAFSQRYACKLIPDVCMHNTSHRNGDVVLLLADFGILRVWAILTISSGKPDPRSYLACEGAGPPY